MTTSGTRRTIRVVTSAAVIGAVAGALIWALGSTAPVSDHAGSHPRPQPLPAPGRKVAAALANDTAAGSFDVTYQFVPSAEVQGDGTISGTGTIDVSPFAMETSSQVAGLGLVTTVDNGTLLWEFGGGGYGSTFSTGGTPTSTVTSGAAPSPTTSSAPPGASLAGFATLVDGTLGPQNGALAMRGLANPTGYLSLATGALAGATPAGTGTVDGVPVWLYSLTSTPAEEDAVTGANPEQQAALTDADDLLAETGYLGSSEQVAVDSAGYIRQTVAVARFSNHSSVTMTTSFSAFGCAGTVGIPGGVPAAPPPAGCVSPDQPGPLPSSP